MSYVTVVGEVTVDDGREFVVEDVDETRFPITSTLARGNNGSHPLFGTRNVSMAMKLRMIVYAIPRFADGDRHGYRGGTFHFRICL